MSKTPKGVTKLGGQARKNAIKARIEKYNYDHRVLTRKYKTAPENVPEEGWRRKERLEAQTLEGQYNEDMLQLSTASPKRSTQPASAFRATALVPAKPPKAKRTFIGD